MDLLITAVSVLTAMVVMGLFKYVGDIKVKNDIILRKENEIKLLNSKILSSVSSDTYAKSVINMQDTHRDNLSLACAEIVQLKDKLEKTTIALRNANSNTAHYKKEAARISDLLERALRSKDNLQNPQVFTQEELKRLRFLTHPDKAHNTEHIFRKIQTMLEK